MICYLYVVLHIHTSFIHLAPVSHLRYVVNEMTNQSKANNLQQNFYMQIIQIIQTSDDKEKEKGNKLTIEIGEYI